MIRQGAQNSAARDPVQVAEWAGRSVDVLSRVHAKCISGREHEAMRRILEATQPVDHDPDSRQDQP